MGQQQYEKDIKQDVATTEKETKNPEVVAEETPVAETEVAETPEPTENGESKEESNANTPE